MELHLKRIKFDCLPEHLQDDRGTEALVNVEFEVVTNETRESFYLRHFTMVENDGKKVAVPPSFIGLHNSDVRHFYFAGDFMIKVLTQIEKAYRDILKDGAVQDQIWSWTKSERKRVK